MWLSCRGLPGCCAYTLAKGPPTDFTLLCGVQAQCAALPAIAEVSGEAVAAALSEAGLDDIAIVDAAALGESRQRVCDTLVLATGRTPQHALAGAR